MKRSTRKLKFEKRSRDWAVGVFRQRGKPDRIVIRVRKDAPVILDIDTVPSSANDEPEKAFAPVPDPEMIKKIFANMVAEAATKITPESPP
jgi:hypothetical protein